MKMFLRFFIPLFMGIVIEYMIINNRLYKDCVEKKSFVSGDFTIDCKIKEAELESDY